MHWIAYTATLNSVQEQQPFNFYNEKKMNEPPGFLPFSSSVYMVNSQATMSQKNLITHSILRET